MIVETPIGAIRVFVETDRVSEVLLPGYKQEISPISTKPETGYESILLEAFNHFFSAQDQKQVSICWDELVKISLPDHSVDAVSRFHAQVYTSLIENVPTSQMISYSGLAELAGNPLAARAVGTAMRKNPLPIIVPCHRVISADGTIGRYMGATSEDGLVMKKWLLHHEGAI